MRGGNRSATSQVLLGSRPSAVPMLRISAADVPEHRRPHLLREVFEPLGVRYDAEPLAGIPVEIDLTLQGLPGLQLFSGRMQGARYRRTRQSTDPTDDVCLMVNPTGQHAIAQRGREIVLDAGEAALVSLTDTLESTNGPPGDFLVLRCPKAQLAGSLSVGQDRFLRRIPHDTPALRLLTKYIGFARQEDAVGNPHLQRVVVSHFYELMAVAIGATRDATEAAQAGGMRAARLYAIKQEITAKLDDPDLSITMLAAKHKLTPRYVQRLFELEATTLTEYVLKQRLARAYSRLSNPCRTGEKISTVAYDCGFGDVSYFNRAFRRQFGIAPSDVRAQAHNVESS
jgi:AraC-like DNA-binding protein